LAGTRKPHHNARENIEQPKSVSLSLRNVIAAVMNHDVENYELYLAVSDGNDEELDEQRVYLRRDLCELEGVIGVKQISAGDAPENARALDLLVVGGLALALKKAGVFDAVVKVLKVWIESGNRRKEKRKVVIKRPDGTMLEFDGYALKEIDGLGDLPAIGAKA
jgi:hypothetical protein